MEQNYVNVTLFQVFKNANYSTWTFEAGGKWERAEEGSEGKEGWSFLSVSVQ